MKYSIFYLILFCFVLFFCCKNKKEEETNKTETLTLSKTTYDSVKKDGIVVFIERNKQFLNGRVLYALHEKSKIQVSSLDSFRKVVENDEFLVILGDREIDVVIVSLKKGKLISSLSQERKNIVKKCIIQLSQAENNLEPTQ